MYQEHQWWGLSCWLGNNLLRIVIENPVYWFITESSGSKKNTNPSKTLEHPVLSLLNTTTFRIESINIFPSLAGFCISNRYILSLKGQWFVDNLTLLSCSNNHWVIYLKGQRIFSLSVIQLLNSIQYLIILIHL